LKGEVEEGVLKGEVEEGALKGEVKGEAEGVIGEAEGVKGEAEGVKGETEGVAVGDWVKVNGEGAIEGVENGEVADEGVLLNW
jgi:chromosome segregation protein